MKLSITINKDIQLNGTRYTMFYAEQHSVECRGAIGVIQPLIKDDIVQGILTEGGRIRTVDLLIKVACIVKKDK